MGKQSERITPRADDYSKWYLDVVRQGDLAEPAEVVKAAWSSSLMVMPSGRKSNVLSTICSRQRATKCLFPNAHSGASLRREAEHVEGFSPELAVVTHAGGKELEGPTWFGQPVRRSSAISSLAGLRATVTCRY